MRSVFCINQELNIPIYQQLVDSVSTAIKSGALEHGSKLPTVQEVSQELNVARGTIKRAYDELEYAGLVEKVQNCFEDALTTREFEPDCPNYTPRISGMLTYANGDFAYKMSILKSRNGDPSVCERFFYHYLPVAGIGHFIHTYQHDGNPIPSFYGEPEEVALPNTAAELAELVWENLNADNKVSLFVRVVPLDGSAPEEIIINKNK